MTSASTSEKLDRANLLYNNATDGLVVSFIAFVALQLWFNDYSQHAISSERMVFLIAMTLITLLRAADLIHWKKARKCGAPVNPDTGFYRFGLGVGLGSAIWAVYGITTLSTMSVEEATCSIVIISALTGGAATVLSGHRLINMLYTLFMLIPYSITLLVSTEPFYQLLGGLGLVFTLTILSIAKKSCNFTFQAILLRHKNDDLLAQLQHALLKVEHTNKNLEQKIALRTKKIKDLSYRDPLTTLFNRNAFQEHLNTFIENATASKMELALLFVDLDKFKEINDHHGHNIGDAVLKEVATRLSAFVTSDRHACRWGGDEFVIILENCSALAAKQTAKTLIDRLSDTLYINDLILNVGATIGISVFPTQSQHGSQLILFADTAMYRQKHKANSSVLIFDEAMLLEQQRIQFLKTALLSAIENDELQLLYQPIFNNEIQRVEACEVLLRWQHGSHSVSPAEFIPIAEKYGMIHLLGEWVLEQACKEMLSFPKQIRPAISVNVSAVQLANKRFVALVEHILKKYHYPSEQLIIELTESAFVEDISEIKTRIEKLKQTGVKISLDDFGTGYSSLALLQSLGANTIKIDKSFVDSIHQGGWTIINATQYIANELHYDVVAEGVETEEQMEILKQLGIRKIQGYFYAKPMHLDDLEEWINSFTASV
jgi:diguanylate cyclase (GGDEF)-like protein